MKNTKYIVHTMQQGTQEWLDFRRDKIGASMAPVIAGVSPYQTKMQLWEEMVLGKTKPDNAPMRRGRNLEKKALDWMNKKKGLSGQYEPVVVQSVEEPHFIASLDGFYVNENGKPHLLEIKCPGIDAHLQAIEGKIPPYYYPQLQHQMDVVGVDEMLYLSFDGKNGVIVPCYRDEGYCESLKNMERKFLALVLEKIAPSVTEDDWVENHDVESVVRSFRYKEICETIDFLQSEKEEIRDYLISKLTHPKTIIGDLKARKITKKGLVDYEKLIKDHGIEDAEQYRKPDTSCWVITSCA